MNIRLQDHSQYYLYWHIKVKGKQTTELVKFSQSCVKTWAFEESNRGLKIFITNI